MNKTTRILSSLFLVGIAVNMFAQTDSIKTSNFIVTKDVADTIHTIEPRHNIGNSVQSRVIINESDFNKGFITSPYELIIGKVAGLSISSYSGVPNSEFETFIRSQNSFIGNNLPLIIIDNIPQYGKTISLNPSDIESITVLKDAASTGLYSEGQNGAISIKTKRGTKRLHVIYTANLALSYLPKQIEVFNADEYRSLINQRYASNPTALGLLGTANTNWQDEIYQTAFSQDHFLSLSGSTNFETGKVFQLPYRMSVGKTIQEGILETSKLDRNSVDVTLDPSFFSNHLRFNLNFKRSESDEHEADEQAIENAIYFDPTRPVKNGSPYGGYFTWMNSDGTIIYQAPSNPMALLNLKDNDINTINSSTNLSADYKLHFLPELRIIANYALNKLENSNIQTVKPEGKTLFNRSESNVKGNIDSKYWDLNINYSKYFNAISSQLDVFAGLSKYETEESYEYSYVDYLGGGSSIFKFESKFAGGSFCYNERYTILLNAREDGTSVFAPENQKATFLSGGIAWNVKNEAFLANNEFLSKLNLRASLGTSSQSFIPVSSNTSIANPNLTYENIKTFNLGVDFDFWKDRLNGSAEYYTKEGDDLMTYMPMPMGGNLSYVLANGGSTSSKGIDITINTRIVATKTWRWGASANLNYNKSEINDIIKGMDIRIPTGYAEGSYGQYTQMQKGGYPFNTFNLYKQIYNTSGQPIEGQYVDTNGSGNTNEEDKVMMKNPQPDVIMGISSQLGYKNWEFSFSGRWSMNNYIYNNVSSNCYYEMLYFNSGRVPSNLPTSINNTKFESMQPLSDYYLENASFFKMDYMSLGYQFNKLFRSNLGLNISATVQNVFTITNYSGQDPEVVGGIDYFQYPRPRTVSIKLSFMF